MIKMDRGTWEGVRFIDTRFIIHPDMVETVMREFGLTAEQVREEFIVTSRLKVEPVKPVDPSVAANAKALHQQELQRISRRGKGWAK